MSCPKYGSESIGTVPIIKGHSNNKPYIGINVFCKNMNCDWEIDKKHRGG